MTAPLYTSVRESDALPARMEDYWDEPLVGEPTLRPAHDDLQGAWLTISGRREAVFLISGNHFTVRLLGRRHLHGHLRDSPGDAAETHGYAHRGRAAAPQGKDDVVHLRTG